MSHEPAPDDLVTAGFIQSMGYWLPSCRRLFYFPKAAVTEPEERWLWREIKIFNQHVNAECAGLKPYLRVSKARELLEIARGRPLTPEESATYQRRVAAQREANTRYRARQRELRRVAEAASAGLTPEQYEARERRRAGKLLAQARYRAQKKAGASEGAGQVEPIGDADTDGKGSQSVRPDPVQRG